MNKSETYKRLAKFALEAIECDVNEYDIPISNYYGTLQDIYVACSPQNYTDPDLLRELLEFLWDHYSELFGANLKLFKEVLNQAGYMSNPELAAVRRKIKEKLGFTTKVIK